MLTNGLQGGHIDTTSALNTHRNLFVIINLVKENLCFLYSDQSSIESALVKINLLINILGFNLGEFIFFLSFGGFSVSVIKLSLSSRSRPWTQKSQYLGVELIELNYDCNN